jgi:hypothetical protein
VSLLPPCLRSHPPRPRAFTSPCLRSRPPRPSIHRASRRLRACSEVVGGFALGGLAVGVVAFWRPSEAVPKCPVTVRRFTARCFLSQGLTNKGLRTTSRVFFSMAKKGVPRLEHSPTEWERANEFAVLLARMLLQPFLPCASERARAASVCSVWASFVHFEVVPPKA